ncbi:MAG: hypothetical protein M3R45_11630 [Pseudomonadota bacterium]|nr:hypothetical protein [Pseudomonadota bacterium]
MLENNWHFSDRPELGAMNNANSLLRSLDVGDPDALPNLRNASTILIGSDYSGQHSTSLFEAFGFVFANLNESQPWMAARKKIREKFMPDGRRFSYKTLGDRHRSVALPHFLRATDLLSGLLVVVLVHKEIESLFKSSGKILATDPEIYSLSHWAPHVVEKLLRVCHFVVFFLAGLSREDQDVLWISDQDDIAANVDKHREFVSTFGNIGSHYLSHTLRNLQIATTASDTGKRDVEDFVAIADFAAGAVCEAMNAYHRIDMAPVPGVILPIPNHIDEKALRLMHWFSDRRSSLKRLVIGFEPVVGTTHLRVRHYSFQGSHSVLI